MVRVAQTDLPHHDVPARLNLLVSYGGWSEASVVDHLAHLLEPLGISSYRAASGDEAESVIRQRPIHIAIVDLAIPLCQDKQQSPGGARIIQILRRLDQPPPTVIVRPPQPAARENVRGLGEALREGAFAVVDRPLKLETLLEIMRRVVRRHYKDHWPTA